MRLFGGVPNIRKMIARAVFALGVVFCAATPAAAGVSLAISISPTSPHSATISPGDITRVRIQINNTDETAAVTNVQFTDNLPTGVSELHVVAGGTVLYQCTGSATQGGSISTTTGTGTLTASGNLIQLQNGVIPIAPSQSTPASCIIDVDVTSSTGNQNPQVAIAPGGLSTSVGIYAAGAAQSITVLGFNAPSISKHFSPNSIVKGDGFSTLTIQISNATNATADLPLNGAGDTPAYAIEDILPLGLEVDPTPTATASCPGGTAPTFETPATTRTVRFIGGVVAAGGSCTMTVRVVGASTGGNPSNLLTNTIAAGPTSGFANKRGIAATGAATDSITVTSALVVSTHFNLANVAAGQISTITVKIDNQSGVALSQSGSWVSLLDGALSADGKGLFVDQTGPQQLDKVNCGSATLVASGSNESFTLSNATFAAHTICTLTIPYHGIMHVTSGASENYTHTIAAGAVVTGDASVISFAASDSVNIINAILVDKLVENSAPASTPGQPSVAPGGIVKYHIIPGSYVGHVTDLVVTDHLPSGMTIVNNATYPATVGGVTGCSGLLVGGTATDPTFTIPNFPAGVAGDAGRCDIFFYAQAPTNLPIGTQLINTISPGDVLAEHGAIGNLNSTAPGVYFRDGLTVTKQFSPVSQAEGAPSTLTITVSNIGSEPVTATTITDNLPTGTNNASHQLVIANPAVASSTCVGASLSALTPGATSVVVTGATVAARDQNGTGPNPGQCTITVNVTGPADSYHNIILGGQVHGTQALPGGGTITPQNPGPGSASDVTFTSALQADKAFSPATISPGGASQVTVTLRNTGASILTGVVVTDPLPTGMVVDSSPGAGTTCGGAPSFNVVAGASTASMTGASIQPGNTCTFQFNVRGTGNNPWPNIIPPGGIHADGNVSNVSAVSSTLGNANSSAVVVSVNFSPNSLNSPGSPSTLTIELRNNGTLDLTNLSLTNYFTKGVNQGLANGDISGLVVAPNDPTPSTTCTNGTPIAVANGNNVALTGATLPAGQICTVTVHVTMNVVTTVQNYIPAGAVHDDQNVSNDLFATSSLTTGSNLGVSKQFTPPVVKPNERSRLQITLYNLKPFDVSGITFTDALPSGLTIPASPNPTTTCGGAFAAVDATHAQLTGGALAQANAGNATTCIAEIDVIAVSEGAYINTIGTSQVSGNGGAVTNPDPASATLQVRTPVAILKTFAHPVRLLGEANTTTITFANPNNIALTNTKLVDTFPPGLFVATPSNASVGACGGSISAPPSSGGVTLTGATLPANGTCSITFDVVSNTAASYTNPIPAGRLQTLIGVTNEIPTSATMVVKSPPPVTKSFSPPVIPAGATSTLTITLGNANADPAVLSTIFTDTLPTTPGAITVAGAASGTCTAASITATVGTGTVSYASGASIPSGGCTIIVPVTGTINGVHTNIIPAGQLQTDAGNNVTQATATLTISPKGFVSGRVFRDNNITPDGVFNGSDAGIPSVILTLTGHSYGPDGIAGNGDDISVITPSTTTTDSAGAYAFYDLDPGAYIVTETEPSGLLNGITTTGTVTGPGGGTAGTASAQGTTPSTISNVILLTNGVQTSGSPNNNFAEVAPATVSGVVFNDLNDNGVQDSGDTALNGVDVQLLQGSTVLFTVQTNAGGAYSFSNLTPGTYTVREPTQPSGTSDGKVSAGTVGNGGTAGTVSSQGTTPSTITGIILPPGTTTNDNNFAELPAGRSISGTVYIDADDNGLLGASETRLAGVTVTLSGSGSGTAVTDPSGNYTFSGLSVGTYTVTESTQPPGTADGKTTAGSTGGIASTVGTSPSSIIGINLTGGNATSTGNNFGEILRGNPASAGISGRVYVDANDNGIVDPDEVGIAGVTVTLTGTDTTGTPLTKSVVTDANGDYLFNDLPASNAAGYTITELQPANADGKTTAPTGTAAATKPVPAGGPDTITGVVFSLGSLSGYNFGEKPGVAISGKVYKDLNNNGVVDAGEDGISGVTVTLTGTSATGAAVNLTTTTNALGAYSFAAPPSNAAGYTITETQPTLADGKTTAPVGSVTASKPVATGSPDVITGVVLGNTSIAGFNFGEIDPSTKITGYVFGDTNNNGVKDAGEQGLAGVTITLAGTSGAGATVAMTTTTAADGTFVFTGVPPSGATGYTITEVQPSGYNDGKTIVTTGQPGTPNSSKAVNVGDQDRVGGVVVAANTNRGDYIFGEVPIPGLKPPIVNGYVYLDRRHTRLRPTDGSVEGQSGWTVVLRQGNLVICTTTTNDKGFYQFDNLHCPGYEQSGLPTGPGFSITFDKDGSNLPAVPTSGGDRGQVPPSGGQILNITLNPSDQVVEQNLPLDPAGTIYNSLTRATVAGAVITISGPAGFDPATHLVGGLAAQTQTTGTDGLYQFLLQNGYPTGTYTLTVTAPANFQPGVSTTIPVCPGALTVRLIPNPALVQAFDNPPPSSAPNSCPGLIAGGANSTQYYLQFVITNGGSADILNNHIPLDPVLVGALFITKMSPMVNVARGDLVPYTITATNTETRASGSVTIRDQLPAGFKYRDGTATKNGAKAAPTVENGFVTWPAETFAPKQKNSYTLMLTVGAGVSDGDYVNRAWGAVPTAPGAPATNIASATVRIVPDPTFDCPDIIGKVFDDKNANGFQDDGEPGIPAVRVATANGLLITSDAEGRFHIPCPMTPDQDRGSNFVLKLDARSLPSGFRLTTENPASIRVTRGKMVKLNFGATIHRVVRVELSDAAFEPGTANLKAEFRASIETMPAALAERPSVVRLAYRTGSDTTDLVKKRIEAVRALIRNGWTASKGRYPLDVEVEGGQQ
jgi:uncharacterized repeat protein (TIGR01451 family)